MVISQDLDEIFEVATEIAVISAKASCPRHLSGLEDLSREKIGLLMGGMYGKTETCGRRPACALNLKNGVPTSPSCFTILSPLHRARC